MAAFAVFHQNDGQRLVAVNADQVISLLPSGGGTLINLAGEELSLRVEESFETVLQELRRQSDMASMSKSWAA